MNDPTTEAGRALVWQYQTPETVEALSDRILAIEQEAASKAVAEVLDRLAGALCQTQHAYHPATDYGPCYLCVTLARKIAALIASERKP